MNARGNSLLMEEKERNKVNKTLPRVEEELHALIKGTNALMDQFFFRSFLSVRSFPRLFGLACSSLCI